MSFAVGVAAFTDAIGLMRDHRIAKFVWMPAVVALIVVGSTLGIVLANVDLAVAWILAQLPEWLGFIEWVLAPLAYVLGILIGALVFSYAATVIASPFLGILSARVTLLATGQAPSSQLNTAAMIAATLGREGRKLLYHLPRVLMVFLFTLLPVINVVAPIVWFAFGAWIMAVQFVDYAPENEDIDFRAALSTLKQHRAAALGFGAPTALAMAIPIVNIVAVPVAVVGGTLLWHRLRRERN